MNMNNIKQYWQYKAGFKICQNIDNNIKKGWMGKIEFKCPQFLAFSRNGQNTNLSRR